MDPFSDPQALRAWRKAERERLIAARLALPPATLAAHRESIDHTIEYGFPGLAGSLVAFCWPFQNEYDARFVLARLRRAGTRTALPVVVAPKSPMIFREWRPGTPLAKGVYDIPYPADGPAVLPQAAIVPMNGFDAGGYRLGYGGGFFDRTLATLDPRPVVIGVTFELARLDTIHPQPYDIPMDYVATERGLYRRDADGLAFLGRPLPPAAGADRSSPVCYAADVDPGYFGADAGPGGADVEPRKSR